MARISKAMKIHKSPATPGNLLGKLIAKWPATKRHIQTVAGARKRGN